MEGVVLLPSLLGITTGSLPSMTATHEFVVPKSIPIILPISVSFNISLFLELLIVLLSVLKGYAKGKFPANCVTH
jgi:hypothetical protein